MTNNNKFDNDARQRLTLNSQNFSFPITSSLSPSSLSSQSDIDRELQYINIDLSPFHFGQVKNNNNNNIVINRKKLSDIITSALDLIDELNFDNDDNDKYSDNNLSSSSQDDSL